MFWEILFFFLDRKKLLYNCEDFLSIMISSVFVFPPGEKLERDKEILHDVTEQHSSVSESRTHSVKQFDFSS